MLRTSCLFGIALLVLAACSGSPVHLPLATVTPTPSPTASPTVAPTTKPTTTPTAVPTATPSLAPTLTPSPVPTATPTLVPTASPSATPMPTPTVSAAIVASAGGSCQTSGTPSTSNGVSCNISGSTITYASQFASTLGLTNSNSTGNPVLASSYYFTNPGTFAVSGTVFGAARTVLNDAPSALSAQQFYATFTFTEQSTAPTFLPNTPFTCTAYDNGTLLGLASATTGGGTNGSTITATASCYIAYPSFAVASSAAMIVLPSASVNANDVYTFLLSQ